MLLISFLFLIVAVHYTYQYNSGCLAPQFQTIMARNLALASNRRLLNTITIDVHQLIFIVKLNKYC